MTRRETKSFPKVESMKRSMSVLQRGLTLALVVVVAGSMACRTAQPVDEEPEVREPTRYEMISEATGLSIEMLEQFEQAVALMQDGEFSRSAELFKSLVEREDTFAEAHYNLGLLYGDMGRPDEAVQHIQKARQLDPDVFDYTIAMAKAYAEAERFDDARRLFGEVITRQPDNLVAKNNLAVIALRQGEEEEAMRYITEILREDNKNVGALNTLGMINMQAGNLSLAKYALRKALEEDEEYTDALNNLGLVYMQEDNVPAAVRAFTRAINSDTNYLEARLNLAAILIEYLDYERAHDHFTNAVRISPQNCVANLGLGASSFAVGSHQDAYDQYSFYIERCDEEHYSSFVRLASLAENRLQRPEDAIRYYTKLIDLSEDRNAIANYRASIQMLESQLEQERQQPEAAPEPEPEAEEVADDGEV